MSFSNISKDPSQSEMLSLYSKMFVIVLRIMAVMLVTAIVVSIAGCATVETDLPWNTPQTWEGIITPPGMEY